MPLTMNKESQSHNLRFVALVFINTPNTNSLTVWDVFSDYIFRWVHWGRRTSLAHEALCLFWVQNHAWRTALHHERQPPLLLWLFWITVCRILWGLRWKHRCVIAIAKIARSDSLLFRQLCNSSNLSFPHYLHSIRSWPCPDDLWGCTLACNRPLLLLCPLQGITTGMPFLAQTRPHLLLQGLQSGWRH